MERRQVKNDYTVRFERHRYGIQPESISTGLQGTEVRVEKRLDGAVTVRFQDRYLSVKVCAVLPKATAAAKPKPAGPNSGKGSPARPKSGWMNGFWKKPGPRLAQAIEIANASS